MMKCVVVAVFGRQSPVVVLLDSPQYGAARRASIRTHGLLVSITICQYQNTWPPGLYNHLPVSEHMASWSV